VTRKGKKGGNGLGREGAKQGGKGIVSHRVFKTQAKASMSTSL